MAAKNQRPYDKVGVKLTLSLMIYACGIMVSESNPDLLDNSIDESAMRNLLEKYLKYDSLDGHIERQAFREKLKMLLKMK